MDVLADLAAEQDRLERILSTLPQPSWDSPSAAPGWTVADVVLHLAQTEEAVVRSAQGRDVRGEFGAAAPEPGAGAGALDEAMDRWVRAERAAPDAVFQRWRAARRAALDALRGADPARPIAWAAAPLKPATLATTRLAEHWAHGLDIAGPLGIPFPDTDRLRHVAWLAHGSLPYAFALAGQPPHEVYCELTAPDGEQVWRYGPAGAESVITGSAGAFCRVGARRLAADESGLQARGPYGPAALRVLRNYAA
jgi:uncharacterized protein (TIGR03084 family)